MMPARRARSSMQTRPPQRRGGLASSGWMAGQSCPRTRVVVVIVLAADRADEQSEQQEATEGENHAPTGRTGPGPRRVRSPRPRPAAEAPRLLAAAARPPAPPRP